jgi:hypothetical protein
MTAPTPALEIKGVPIPPRALKNMVFGITKF